MVCVLCADPENTEGADLQRKLELLNNIVDQETRAGQARRQLQYYGHCEYKLSCKYQPYHLGCLSDMYRIRERYCHCIFQ